MNEFIDAYSDDKSYLEQYEILLQKHRGSTEALYIPMLCRFHIVSCIGAVEMCIKQWMENKASDLYNVYFKKNTRNEQKVVALKNAFLNLGLRVEDSVLDDFLALKYLRNTIIHSEWDQDQRIYVLGRGFPDNIMKFNRTHLHRIKSISEKMGTYQGLFLIHSQNS